MLASTFLSAEQLQLSHDELVALIKVLGMMESGEIKDVQPHGFGYVTDAGGKYLYMGRFFGTHWDQEGCGTAACMAGWAHHVSKGKAFPELTRIECHTEFMYRLCERLSSDAQELFHVNMMGPSGRIFVADAATRLRNFLTTGTVAG